MARLSIRQKKTISKSIKLTHQELNLILNYNNDWDNLNLKPIKDRIRDFYLKEQNKLCAFCKLPFRDDIHVEHVVPKSGKYGRKEYAFVGINLAVACKHCNSKKSTNNDMIPWSLSPYPQSGMYFKILHPHFDDYFKHIEIVDNSRYVRKTLKGHNTIERCKLYDPKILEVLSECMRYQDDPLIQGVLRLREIQGNFKATIDNFINAIFR